MSVNLTKVKMKSRHDIIMGTITHDRVPALRALIESAYRGDSAKRGWTHEADLLGGQRTDEAALEDVLAHEDAILLVAERDGALIGCVQGTRVSDTHAYLGLLTVDPELQASGLGRKLITAIEEAVREQFGVTHMEMTVIKQRAELIAYYERRGYRQTGEMRPFPLDDERFGLPKTRELEFVVLEKAL